MALRGASSRRYAEAVFELAAEEGKLAEWDADLATIAGFVGEADVMRVLSSGRIPSSEKLRLLEAGLKPALSRPEAWNLVQLLESRNKLHLAPQIRRAYQQLADDRRGIAHATVTTAVPLSEDEREAITARLSSITGRQVDVTPVVDESIIGGLVARIGDQLIDGSTRTRLIALKRRITAAT